MADVLECLVQIRALGETARRVKAFVSEASRLAARHDSVRGLPAILHLVEELADAEQLFATRLRLILSGHSAVLPSEERDGSRVGRGANASLVRDALERFSGQRQANLKLLARCSATDLSRTGRHPERGDVSLADLVALALANDTEQLGWARQHLVDAAIRRPAEGGS